MADKSTLHKVEIRYIPAKQLGLLFMKASQGDPAAFLDPKDMELIDMPGFEGSRRPVTHPKNLMTIYKHYQRIVDTPDERTAAIKARSMSVGDAIVYKGVAYYVGPNETGFLVRDESGELVAVTPDNCGG